MALEPKAIPEAQAARPGLVVYDHIEVERLHGTKDGNLIRAVHAAKKALSGRVQDPKMADGILAEYEGRVPHPNQGVHDMCTEARVRLGTRDLEEHSLTSWLRRHAAELAAKWPEAPLTASWFDWRQHVGPEHVPALDEAFRSVTGYSPLRQEPSDAGSQPRKEESP